MVYLQYITRKMPFLCSTGGNSVYAHIGAQDFWYEDGAVGLLIVFDDRDPGAPDGEAGAIQSMNEVAFSAGFGLEADAGAPRLKSFAVRAGRNFAKFVDTLNGSGLADGRTWIAV